MAWIWILNLIVVVPDWEVDRMVEVLMVPQHTNTFCEPMVTRVQQMPLATDTTFVQPHLPM